jgi:hypothetical protein
MATSHEALCMVNPADEGATVALIGYVADREPLTGLRVDVSTPCASTTPSPSACGAAAWTRGRPKASLALFTTQR